MGSSSNKIIVGISWRGGGREDRIKQKSLSIALFSKLIQGLDDIIFVSLQYGDVSSDIKEFCQLGCDIIHDKSINPLKDMDGWLSQVAACDAVLSVANTTIHGSGGLNKPTMCLSQDSDWRWLKDSSVERSYWYPQLALLVSYHLGHGMTLLRLVLGLIRCHYPEGRKFV